MGIMRLPIQNRGEPFKVVSFHDDRMIHLDCDLIFL